MAEQWQINEGEFEKLLREADLEALEQYERGTAEAPVLYKGFGETKAISEAGPVEFVASEESEDRMGDVIEAAGWQLNNFKRNPVFLWSHNNFEPPIGRVDRIGVQGKQLLATVTFDSADERAAEIEGKFRRGFMKAVSVGFRPLDFKRVDSDKGIGFRFIEQELLELSAVSVPAHPKALARAKAMATESSKLWVPGWGPEREQDSSSAASVETEADIDAKDYGDTVTIDTATNATDTTVTTDSVTATIKWAGYCGDAPEDLTYEDVKEAAKEAIIEALASKDISQAIKARLADEQSGQEPEQDNLDYESILAALGAAKSQFTAQDDKEG